MSALTRGVAAELVSREQNVRRERGQREKHVFRVQLTTSRTGSHIRLMFSLLNVTVIHLYSGDDAVG